MNAAHESAAHLPEPLIRQVANNLVGRYRLTESDREDIEQFLRTRVLKAWPKYDPARSRPNTFADRVIDAAVASYIRDRTRQKRNPSREEAEFDFTDHGPATDRHYDDRIILELDMRISLQALSDEDRRFAYLLMDYGPVEARRRSGLTIRKAQTARKRIKAALESAGMDRYVTNDWERN